MKLLGRSKRRFIVLFLLLVLIPTGCAAAYGTQIRCQFVGWSGMRSLPGNVYVDPAMSDSERAAFEAIHTSAVNRNRQFFGELFSSPIVIVASTPELMNRYGQPGNRTAVTHLAFGTASVVIGPDGANIDVVAHELLHAEVAHRIGWWCREMRLPVWFDEGLAMQVDDREAFGEQAWMARTDAGATAPDVTQLNTQRSFFTENSWVHYATSKHEVARWMKVVGRDGLLQLLRDLKDGRSFTDSYQSIETAHAQTIAR